MKIYREVLIEPNAILTSPASTAPPIEPPLLWTCRQIRKEALSIYYEENNFTWDIEDNNASLYIQWCRAQPSRAKVEANFLLEDSQNWPNLMKWVDACGQGECRRPEEEPEELELAAIHVLDVAVSMAGAVSWEKMQTLLSKMRNALACEHWEWAEGVWKPEDDESLEVGAPVNMICGRKCR